MTEPPVNIAAGAYLPLEDDDWRAYSENCQLRRMTYHQGRLPPQTGFPRRGHRSRGLYPAIRGTPDRRTYPGKRPSVEIVRRIDGNPAAYV